MVERLNDITRELISQDSSYGFIPDSRILDLSEIVPLFVFEAVFRQCGQKDIKGVDIFYPKNGILTSSLELFNIDNSLIPRYIEQSPNTIPNKNIGSQTPYLLTGILPQGFRGIARNYMFQDFESSLHFNPLRDKNLIRTFQREAGVTVIDIGDFPNGYAN